MTGYRGVPGRADTDSVDQLVTMVSRAMRPVRASGYALPECTLLGRTPRQLASLLSITDVESGVYVMPYRTEPYIIAELGPDEPYRRLRNPADEVDSPPGSPVYAVALGTVIAAADTSIEIDLLARECSPIAALHGASGLIARYSGLLTVSVRRGDAAWCGRIVGITGSGSFRFELRTREGAIPVDPHELLAGMR